MSLRLPLPAELLLELSPLAYDHDLLRSYASQRNSGTAEAILLARPTLLLTTTDAHTESGLTM